MLSLIVLQIFIFLQSGQTMLMHALCSMLEQELSKQILQGITHSVKTLLSKHEFSAMLKLIKKLLNLIFDYHN